MDGWMALADSFQNATQVRFVIIQSTDEVINDLGIFAFITDHLFSVGRIHAMTVCISTTSY